jgi:hypothetical protein
VAALVYMGASFTTSGAVLSATWYVPLFQNE